MLAIEGIPIFYLELAIGQRLRKGAIGVWNQVIVARCTYNAIRRNRILRPSDHIRCFLTQVSPYMGGIGVSSAVVSFNVALYYNTIIAWCLFYFVQVSIIVLLFFFLGKFCSNKAMLRCWRKIIREYKCCKKINSKRDERASSLKLPKIIFQSFQSKLPWAECPNVYFQNGSYAPESECVVGSKNSN